MRALVWAARILVKPSAPPGISTAALNQRSTSWSPTFEMASRAPSRTTPPSLRSIFADRPASRTMLSQSVSSSASPVSTIGSWATLTTPLGSARASHSIHFTSDPRNAEISFSVFARCQTISIGPIARGHDAVPVFQEKKHLRVVRLPTGAAAGPDWKRIRGGFLAQQRSRIEQVMDETGWKVVTKRPPTEREWRDLRFAWGAVGAVKSNAF